MESACLSSCRRGWTFRLWESPLKSAAEQTEPEDILREFRMASALAVFEPDFS